MDNRKKRLLGMGFVVAVLFAASMLAFQMQKAAPAAAPAQPAGQKLPIIMYPVSYTHLTLPTIA